MNTKKAISSLVMLLAVGSLLAHSFVPHHHHNRVPVAIDAPHHGHIGDTSYDHHHHPDESVPAHHSDTGHGHDSKEVCFVEKEYTVSEKRQHGESCPCCFHPAAILLAFYNSISDIPADEGSALRSKPPLITYHYEYLTRSLGLRAPPVC